MTGATLTFIISFLGIVGMFAVKLVEARTGKQSLLSRISDRTNHIVHDAVARARHIMSFVTKRNAILLGRFIAYHVLLTAHRLYIKAKRSIKTYLEKKPSSPINLILGKGEIKKKGSVSFFLKHIAEESKKREVAQ